MKRLSETLTHASPCMNLVQINLDKSTDSAESLPLLLNGLN